ncbi:hypothetical protein [Deinococcus sp.]|uniref:hypothetical protein n=1 Tax=Deinococcus sp. TaxID=47478 RepID=UPI00391AB2BD
MTTNDRSTPKKAENAQVQAVRKEFTLTGSKQNLDPAALGNRPPLELLADWLEAEAACDGTREASVLAVLTRGRLRELNPAALRAQAEADKGLREALAHYAELRHYDHAGRLWSGNPDEHEDAQVDFGEIARAALAQAGIVGGTP